MAYSVRFLTNAQVKYESFQIKSYSFMNRTFSYIHSHLLIAQSEDDSQGGNL